MTTPLQPDTVRLQASGLTSPISIGFAMAVLGIALLGALRLGVSASIAAVAALAILAAAGAAIVAFGIFASHPAQAPLAKESDWLLAYCAGLPEGVLLTHPDGKIVFVNIAFWNLLEPEATVPHGTSRSAESTDYFSANRLARYLPGSQDAIYRLVVATRNSRQWEEVVELPSRLAGHQASRWLRISVQPVSAVGADATYIAWRIADATIERSVQNDTIQRLLRNIEGLDRIPAGLVTLGANNRVSYVNRTLADWLGTEPAAVAASNMTVEQLFGAEIITALTAAATSPTKNRPITADVNLGVPGQGPLPVRLICQSTSDGGALTGAVVLSKASLSLQVGNDGPAEARFTRLFQDAPIAIATLDRNGLIGSANTAFRQMFAIAPASRSTGTLDVLECLHEDSRPTLRKALTLASQAPHSAQPVEILLGPDKRRSGQIFLGPNPAAEGGSESLILFALDTTERKELEAQFAQSQKMQAIGQLAGGIAHDINNVLTVIIGFSDLLLANSAGDPAFHDLNEIKANANRAANLVRQLLAYSRRQTLRPGVLSLNEVISEMTVFLKRSLGEKVRLERDYGRDLWLVKADQTELGRVFVNLAVNAVDAMPNGGRLTIRTANIPREQSAQLSLTGLVPQDYIMCEVADSGSGMPPEVLERIFEPFFTTKEVGKGTGLGLSTVYGIVKQTGGYIYCDSHLGEGTTFRIFLPRHIGGVDGTEATAKPERHEKARDLTGTGVVLLVEDEESVRRFAARALRRQGYQVLEAANGVDALEVKAAHDGAIDLVVSDIVMPEMDGPSLLKELRKTNPDLKIIFMSGYADDALSTLSGSDEFAFLSKPFQLADLVSAVKAALSI